MFGREKMYGETDWKRRLGYALLGEMHIPGRLRIWHLVKELKRLGYWKNAPLSLLDAGGGEGAFAYYCARRFPQWQVVVADNESDTLNRGHKIKQQLNLDNLDVRFAALLAFNEVDTYDVVICSDVLEHIEDDELVVQNLARSLKPRGVVILTSPSIPQRKHLPLVARRERQIGFHPSDYGHVRDGYAKKDMYRMFADANLEVNAIRWTYGRFGTLMFDLFFITGDSRPNPLVYMALFPLYMGLSVLDVSLPNASGCGILVVGQKG